eukprot:TRINITY_DN38333_c0_g1_i1.p1 TRINITY_DN38333_c0_g1~~TRINITY_DN38333_c0_g1_i1.p1  ORF type:complete len:1006 (+),score=140.28 TRINITY_DN38333_c0_g1_i1:100-3117(+)
MLRESVRGIIAVVLHFAVRATPDDFGDTLVEDGCWDDAAGRVRLVTCTSEVETESTEVLHRCCRELPNVPWASLAQSGLLRSEWASMLQPLEYPGRCQDLPQIAMDVFLCFHHPDCSVIKDADVVRRVVVQDVGGGFDTLWRICAPAALLLLLAEIEGTLLHASRRSCAPREEGGDQPFVLEASADPGACATVPVLEMSVALLRYFVLRTGWREVEFHPFDRVMMKKGGHGEVDVLEQSHGSEAETGSLVAFFLLEGLLDNAEARTVAELRAQVALVRRPDARCDVCCTHATCPTEEASDTRDPVIAELGRGLPPLCPSDRKFDAIQDMRDGIFARVGIISRSVVDVNEGTDPMPQFPWCDTVERTKTTGATLEQDAQHMWEAAQSNSCVAFFIGEKFICYVQHQRRLRAFLAVRMLEQAGLLYFFCLGCSANVWPLPFSIEDLWSNLFLAVRAAAAVGRIASSASEAGSEPSSELVTGMLEMIIRLPIWKVGQEEVKLPGGIEKEEKRGKVDEEKEKHEEREQDGDEEGTAAVEWGHSPLEHCPRRFESVCVSRGRLEAANSAGMGWHRGTAPGGPASGWAMFSCHSAMAYAIHRRSHVGLSDGVKQENAATTTNVEESSERVLLLLPLADLSLHITEAVRTWFGGALQLVSGLLGGPERVEVLIVDDGEVMPFGVVPRAVRYGGNHRLGFGTRRKLGFFAPLMATLSDLPVRWLSALPDDRRRCYADAVWGFRLLGSAHGRGMEMDCSGTFCFAVGPVRSMAFQRGRSVLTAAPTIRRFLDSAFSGTIHGSRLQPRRRLRDSLRILLVQRPSWRPRHVVSARAIAGKWRHFLDRRPIAGVALSADLIVWRPEALPVVAQVKTLMLTDVLSAVSGQACGLGAFMRGGRVILELTPALDGPYRCRTGWDANPTSEVGQVARLAALHHRCVMVDGDLSTVDQRGEEKEVLESLLWRVARDIVVPPLTSSSSGVGSGGLKRILREAVWLVVRARRHDGPQRVSSSGL